jgi:hypothetical protein
MKMRDMGLPDFFIIGAPKAGSTALHEALVNHPQLYLSPVKEPKFFLCDGPPTNQRGPGDAHSAQEWVWRQDRYERLFDAAPAGTLKGESTPFYLWDKAAHGRIQAATPNAKLIAVIRDPIDRAYSNWTHLWCDGLEPIPDFLAACDREQERVEAGWAPFWRYQELGHYGDQLQHLLTLFPREHVHVLKYRELVGQPEETLDRICRFLGVDEGRISIVPSSNVSTWVEPTAANQALRQLVRVGAAGGAYVPPQVWRTASRPLLHVLHRGGRQRPQLDPEVRQVLVQRFAADVGLLGEVMGQSYADWLSPVGRGTYSARRS